MIAVATDEAEVETFAADRIETRDDIIFDKDARAVRARRTRSLGAIALKSEPRPIRAEDDVSSALARGLADLGIDALPWTKAQLQLRNRVAFLRQNDDAWPDLSDAALKKTVEEWLGSFLLGKSRASEIDAETLENAVTTSFPCVEGPPRRRSPNAFRCADGEQVRARL